MKKESKKKFLKNNIISFVIGTISYSERYLDDQINDEKETTSKVKVALPTLSEYLRANSNKEQCGTLSLYNDNYSTCINLDWMYYSSDYWWTLSPDSGNFFSVYRVNYNGTVIGLNPSSPGSAVRPTITLSSEVQIMGGDGSQSKPFQISI